MNVALPLRNDQVHIWFLDPTKVQEPRLLEAYHRLLSTQEHAKWQRYRFDKDKHQHLVTRALIRHTLSLYHPQIEPQEWLFQLNEHGKPSIANSGFEALHFNLSHTQNLAALAITQLGPVGVDVEKMKTVEHVRGLAERCFTDAERRYLFAETDSLLWRFFQLWTLKEAYIKGCGRGMSLSLHSFSFDLSRNPIQAHFDSNHDHSTQWHFRMWQASQEHLLSLAIPSAHPVNISFFDTVPLEQHAPSAMPEITA